MYDSWQSNCILTAEPVTEDRPGTNGNCSAAANWNACSHDPEHCDTNQIDQYNEFGGYLVDRVRAGIKPESDGAFLVSCHTHCEAQSSHSYVGMEIDGVTISQVIYI